MSKALRLVQITVEHQDCKHQASTVFPLIKSFCQELLTYKISTFADLIGKSRKEIVKTLIKIIKTISSFHVVCRKLGCAFFYRCFVAVYM